ncbi:alpha-galactosidase [Paenibacillus radicis (ex Gao et al. 2016)]|uniref:Alpha-galactosidase n=1 Tax=Paenibacillus radicis (ex Gao et al. 2016) TaxID=1737354 RepID=A0A917HHC1_9BACL|nr:alpha-galactosidase [Paenibacillus radicis (ex Gao et al. 2016)]GGG79008.1 alpha-galactosidase [Paenibacillus radicis (ex Gao et al. 2016)]
MTTDIGQFKLEQASGTFAADNGLLKVTANTEDGTLALAWRDGQTMTGLYAEARVGAEIARSSYYGSHTVPEASVQAIEDGFGEGLRFSFEHTEPGKPVLRQLIRLYKDLPYALIELEAEGEQEWETNELTPLASYLNDDGLLDFGDGSKEEIRSLFIPYDNDKWVRFGSHANPASVRSYEVTAIYRAESRRGFVIGSVTHDIWKTSIDVEGTFSEAIGRLRVLAGAADLQTRDTVPHGSLRGTSIKSPTIFVGAFADYREGMEAYSGANAVIQPALTWSGGVPVGWNSWSAVMAKLDYDVYTHTSDFFAKEIQGNGFADQDGSLYVNFDACSHNLKEGEIEDAVRRVKANGQKPGTYYTPFAFWGSDPDTPVEGTDGAVLYREILLKDAAGKPLPKLDGAFPIDPSHPEAIARIMRNLDEVTSMGFEYLKMDFLAHGAMEGVHYDPSIRTGIQAYNYGMAAIAEALSPERLGRPFLINLSIAPLFPHGYAHSRRVSCDAFGTIADTEYMLNALTYGWWISDNLYRFNDPDHIVLYKSDNQRSISEHEGRSRLNSGVISGTSLLLGDDYRMEEAASRAKAWMTNKEVMALAKRGETFRPAEGRSGTGGEDLYSLAGDGGTYVAVFNFDVEKGKSKSIDLSRVGIDWAKALTVRDLWSGESYSLQPGAAEHVLALEPAESKLLFYI